MAFSPIKLSGGCDEGSSPRSLIEAFQRLSGQFESENLTRDLMTISLESGGADRGLMLLARDQHFEVETEATFGSSGIQLKPDRRPLEQAESAKNLINAVINSRKSIHIEDVSQAGEFSSDPYLQQGAVKSVLCLPLVARGHLNALLYLENREAPGAFNQGRIAFLEALASQAAVSLEQARLYDQLKNREQNARELLQKVQVAVLVYAANSELLSANSMAQDLLGIDEARKGNNNAVDPTWRLVAEDHSLIPPEAYPLNQVLNTQAGLSNYFAGVERSDREGTVWVLINAAPVFDEADRVSQVIVSFSDISEWKTNEQQLVANEQLFRTLVENSPDHISRYDSELRRVYINPAFEQHFTVPLDQVIGTTSKQSSPILDTERFMENLQQVIDSGHEVSDETAYRTPQGKVRWASSRFAPEFDLDGKVQSVLVISNDITERKQTELESEDYTQLLETLDRINQVLHGEGDLEQVLQRTLDEVLDIFDCDRAYLQYPCDPDADTEWWIPMERSRPEYASPVPTGAHLPPHPHVVETLRALLESDGPIRLGANTERPIPPEITEKLGIRSLMAVALYPRVDRPWQFGIHQCSGDRIWSDQEARLLEEIGRRLSDGLNSLLILRDQRESEERFRLVFENSPVPIQEEDYSAVKAYLQSLSMEYADDLEAYLGAHPKVVEACAQRVRIIDINHAAMTLHAADDKEAVLRGLPQIFVPETLQDFREILISLMRGETSIRRESTLQTLDGRRYSIEIFLSVTPGYEQSLGKILVSLIDITELKQAEQERKQHLHFLESLDRINRVLQEEGDVEQVVNKALDEVLDIFDCDRVYLLYPCDPGAAHWSVPFERIKPAQSVIPMHGKDLPMTGYMAWEMGLVLNSEQPVRVGPGTPYSVAEFLQREFGIRSVMAMALRPRVDQPWQFGIQQCAYERVWSDQELRLFEEIGHRLSDGLNDLLATRNLRESEERFRLVFENSPVPIAEEDYSAVKQRLETLQMTCDGELRDCLAQHPEVVRECVALVRVVNINNALVQLHAASSKDELYSALERTLAPETLEDFRRVLLALMSGQTELVFDSAVLTLDGDRREVSISVTVCPGYERCLSKVFVSLFDISERKQVEDNMRLAASVFSTSQEGILISDADNHIIDVNPAFTRLTGYSREEVIGRNPGLLRSARQTPEFYASMWRSINERGEWQGELWNQRKSGEVFAELLSIVAVKDELGQLQHYVGAFSDITLIKEHEAELARIANYDVLTGLANRRLLGDRIDHALAHARRAGKILAVCYLDLDGFKPINDRFGHEFGDQVLVEISQRLLAASRGEDTVARLGGDEFVLLWNDIAAERDCVQAVERVLKKVSEPIYLEGKTVNVSASIGLTLFPDDNVDADNLLRHADHAMYTAKQLGKNRYQLFDRRLEREVLARAEMLDRIKRGLASEQFELYYQPKINYDSGQLDSVEALLRWNDPILGVIGAKEFLPLIETDNLGLSVGRWVIEKVLRQARLWHDQGITMPISINIFPHHLSSRNFINDLAELLQTCWPEMPAGRMVMEIVESSDLEEIDRIKRIIEQCREMGFEFSLDDFGTGYSSLVYLRRLSITELKIDKSFVRDMFDDPDDEGIVRSVIGLGLAFGLRVVAEGVESMDQARHLAKLGCPVVQGYALARPMPGRAFESWYSTLSANGFDGLI